MSVKFTKILSDGKFLLVKNGDDNKPFVIGSVYLEAHAELITELLQKHFDETLDDKSKQRLTDK
jgi:hypothetical protein